MKLILLVLLSLSALCAADPSKVSPPVRGGRLLEAAGLRAELIIQSDRRVAVTFLDATGKPSLRGDQRVVIIVDAKRVALEVKTDGYISKEPLGAKEPAALVVQLQAAAETKPVNFRLTLDTSSCGGCRRPEYACTCAH